MLRCVCFGECRKYMLEWQRYLPGKSTQLQKLCLKGTTGGRMEGMRLQGWLRARLKYDDQVEVFK